MKLFIYVVKLSRLFVWIHKCGYLGAGEAISLTGLSGDAFDGEAMDVGARAGVFDGHCANVALLVEV